MKESSLNRVICAVDKQGREERIPYNQLMIQMGEDRLLSLTECLQEEREKVLEFQSNSEKLEKKIRALDPIYEQIDSDPIAYHKAAFQRAQSMNQKSFQERIKLLNTYYTVSSTHDKILKALTDHMLAGSEGDLSEHSTSLIRRTIDYTCRMLRKHPRKTKRPSAIHAIEAARGAAKNGLRTIAIVSTLLHDIIEERLDDWTEGLITRELMDPIYGDYCGKTMKEVPVVLRHKIIQKYIDAYNDCATGLFFHIGLTLYDHVRRFPVPERHYESLHSIMEMIAALSRRRDMSYYSYLQGLLYPKPNAVLDTISYERLLNELEPEFPDAGELLTPYLDNVHNYYQTSLGEYSAKEEVRRNAFREILSKILDRMNNTRDMDRRLGFTVPRRLYGTGFKNIFFLQAIEDKFRRPSFNTQERRLIEVKFLNKPKVAALYQILDDIDFLENEFLGSEMIDFLQNEIERYQGTRAFRRLTPPGRGGYFNGLIYLFNDITLGRKSNLVELEKRRDRQAEVLVAFKAILESFLAYPALIRDEVQARKLKRQDQASYRPYRIVGMGPTLEHRSDARKEQAVDLLDLKTFNRGVI
jgi:hypothetical protein